MSDKLKKHLEALEGATSGNANDAVTFAGKGLKMLKSLINGGKLEKAAIPSSSSSSDLSSSSDSSTSEREGMEEEKRVARDAKRTVKKSAKSSSSTSSDSSSSDMVERRGVRKSETIAERANGGYVTTESSSEIEEDPAGPQRGHAQIANHGERIKAEGAVKKSAFPFDERRFAKSVKQVENTHADVLDASPALADIAKIQRKMAKSISAGMGELQNNIVVIAKALEKSLKAQASLAAELELVKKQPVNAPATGFVVMKKSGKDSQSRTLSKSEIGNAITTAMNDTSLDAEVRRGLGQSLAKLGSAKTNDDVTAVVNALPPSVRERL